MKTVTANGIEFAYLEEGEGPLVLLLHGFPDTAHTWDLVRPRVAALGFRVVCPWLRGYAPTAIPDRDPDAETLGRDVLALIEALGHDDAIVVGHDWGALCTYAAAALNESKIRRMATVAIPHPAVIKPSLKLAWDARHFLFYKLPGAPKRFAKDNWAALRAIYKRWSPEWSPPDSVFTDIIESLSQPGSCDAAFGYYRAQTPKLPRFLLAKPSIPVLCIVGESDGALPPRAAEAGRGRFAGEYEVATVPGGHFLHREHPEPFLAVLLPFLQADLT